VLIFVKADSDVEPSKHSANSSVLIQGSLFIA
jgi:hypothetical protein